MRPNIWDANRCSIHTRKGGLLVGKGAFCHGYDIPNTLMGHATYFQVLILNATGRLVERRLADWLEAAFIGVSYPDPRIWCNQIGAIGGTLRTSPVAAVAGGILASDSRMYGPGTSVEAMEFIQDAFLKKKSGLTPEEIVAAALKRHGGKPYFTGYARPAFKGDERLPAMERVTEALGFQNGGHLTLAKEIEKILLEFYDEGLNLTGYMAAFLSDQDFTPQETYRICAVIVASGVLACYVDSSERPSGTFLPFRCDDINYIGPSLRRLTK